MTTLLYLSNCPCCNARLTATVDSELLMETEEDKWIEWNERNKFELKPAWSEQKKMKAGEIILKDPSVATTNDTPVSFMRGHFEYQDPYEPPGFEFDDESRKEHGVRTLGELIHKLDPDWKKDGYGFRPSNDKSKRFAMVVTPDE